MHEKINDVSFKWCFQLLTVSACDHTYCQVSSNCEFFSPAVLSYINRTCKSCINCPKSGISSTQKSNLLSKRKLLPSSMYSSCLWDLPSSREMSAYRWAYGIWHWNTLKTSHNTVFQVWFYQNTFASGMCLHGWNMVYNMKLAVSIELHYI